MAIDMKLGTRPWWVGALLGGLLLVAVVGVAQFAWPNFGEMQKTIQRLKAENAALEATIQQGQAAERKLPQFREEVRRLELELEKLLRILPSKRQTDELLKRIENLASAGDFDLRRFTPGQTVSKDFYLEWPITISVVGTYHNLALFFDKLSKFSRIINVENLAVTGLPKDKKGNTISANFVSKTFIYQEPSPDAPVASADNEKGKKKKKGKKKAKAAAGDGGKE